MLEQCDDRETEKRHTHTQRLSVVDFSKQAPTNRTAHHRHRAHAIVCPGTLRYSHVRRCKFARLRKMPAPTEEASPSWIQDWLRLKIKAAARYADVGKRTWKKEGGDRPISLARTQRLRGGKY